MEVFTSMGQGLAIMQLKMQAFKSSLVSCIK